MDYLKLTYVSKINPYYIFKKTGWGTGGSNLTDSVHLFRFLFCKLIKNYHRFSIPYAQSTRLCCHPEKSLRYFAGGQGLEPRFFAPKANVLPLDDPPIYVFLHIASVQPAICLTRSELALTLTRIRP